MKKRINLYKKPNFDLQLKPSNQSELLTKKYGKIQDMMAGCWAGSIGDYKRMYIEAISELQFPMHTHQYFENPLHEKLVNQIERLAELDEPYAGTFLTSGSEAVLLGVKLSEAITQRTKKLSLSISYHGAMYELKLPRDPEKWTDFNPNSCMNCPDEKKCSQCHLTQEIDFSKFSAFVFEPGNSGGLIILPPEKLIAYFVNQIKANKGLIVVNEITTGICRTGKFFGYMHYNCFNQKGMQPDIICMGKGLGNGYPISGTILKEKYLTTLENSNYRYVQSHMDDPLGINIAIKTLDVIKDKHLIMASEKKGIFLRNYLTQMNTDKIFTDIRGRGLMNVIILDAKFDTLSVQRQLLEKGYFCEVTPPYNMLRMYPKLTIDKETLIDFTDALIEILN